VDVVVAFLLVKNFGNFLQEISYNGQMKGVYTETVGQACL